MADDISKKITIEVEMETESITQNITSLNKSIDSLLAKQQQLNAAGQQNSAAFEAITQKLEALKASLKEANTQLKANTASLNSLGKAAKSVGGAISSLATKHQKHAKAAGDSSAKSKQLGDQLTILGISNKTAESAVSSLSGQHQKHAKATGDSAAKTKELGGQLSNLGTSNKTAETSVSSLAGQHQKHAKASGDSSAKTKELSGQLASMDKTAKQQKTSTSASKGAMEGLALSTSKASGKTKELQSGTGAATTALNQQASAVTTNKTKFDAHKATMDLLKTSFDKIKDVSGIFGPSLQEAAKGFDLMKNGLALVEGGFKGVGAAIKADGFGVLLNILQMLFDNFVQSSNGAGMLKGVISAIGVIVNTVTTIFHSLMDGIINAFSHPIDTLKSLGKMIEENLINRFKAFSVILHGIIHLDFKEIANGVIQAATGVTNATDKIATGFHKAAAAVKTLGKEMVSAYKQAGEHVDAQDKQVKKSTEKQEKYYKSLKGAINDTEKAEKDKCAAEKEDCKLEKEDCKCDEADKTSSGNNSTNPGTPASPVGGTGNTSDPTDNSGGDKNPPADGKKIEAEKTFQEKLTALKKEAIDKAEDYAKKSAGKIAAGAIDALKKTIEQQSAAKIAGLEKDKATELGNSALTSTQKLAIEQKYKQKEGQVKLKAFKQEQEASIAQAVINVALAITKGASQSGILAEFFIPVIIAETAVQIAKIASQKPPAYASGGLHYTSDGRGGALTGYSKTDNTNAYLRSGEAVVVSEAMQVPWARNLVSAINVGFGGRDFSTTNPGRGYAIGGIFTDGGDANRYYNQPVHDQKDLANSIAYQMINNFPPVYVDVKDINNQQNILAQTVNRVNL